MALTKQRKIEIVDDLEQKTNNQKVIIFAEFKGSKNKNLLELRKQLKTNDSFLMIAKKTLMKLVFDKNNLEIDYKKIEGEVAVIFGFQDQVAPAKIVFDFSKKNPSIKIIGGILERKFRSASDIVQLAKLSSRDEILARLVGTIHAPVSGFVNVLQGNIKGLVYLLNNIKK